MSDETITLPCGLTMRRTADRVETWYMECDLFALRAVNLGFGGIEWKCSIYGFGDGQPNWERTREDAFEHLNARVLALRAALLPPGAFVVRDDAETRKVVARAMVQWMRDHGGEATRDIHAAIADAVLAALREVRRG